METVGNILIPQGGTGNAGESTPRPSLGSPIVSGGGNTLFCGDTSTSSAGRLTSRDQLSKEEAVLGDPINSARYSRGRRGRRGRLAQSGELKEAESDGSQLSLASVASEDTRKRKAKAPSIKSVAAKYKAVAASASATPTEVEDMATEIDTEEDFADLSVVSSKSRAKSTLPSTEEFALELRSQAGRKVEEHIDRQLQAIEEVANRSRNLKGSYVQSLRLAVRNVKAAANELARRSAADENIARLERENAELRSALSSLSNRADKMTEEINYLRKQTHERVNVSKSSAQSTADAPMPISGEEALMERIGAFIESKLAALESRLLSNKALRPPLGVKSMTVVTEQLTTPMQSLSADARSQKKKNKKKARKRQKPTYPPVADLPAVAKPVLQTSASTGTRSWADVAKRPKVHQTTQKSPMNYVSNEQSTKMKRKPVRAPTSAAVTITLREGSTATYGSIMKDAKAKIQLEELGIEGKVSVAKARIFTPVTLGVLTAVCKEKAEDFNVGVYDGSLEHEFLIRQATTVNVNAATQLLTVTLIAIQDTSERLRDALTKEICLVQQAMEWGEGTPPDHWDQLIAVRGSLCDLRHNLRTLFSYMDYAEKLATAAAEISYLSGNVAASDAICERIDHVSSSLINPQNLQHSKTVESCASTRKLRITAEGNHNFT
ncbi:unnamed protein product, partial [Iphiclides podalirius]